jgi:hypothetical protein
MSLMDTAPEHTCGKCGGRMEEGFVKDDADNTVTIGVWVQGRPERSFWTGLKLRGRRRIAIAAMRCDRCGYVELYAFGKQASSPAQADPRPPAGELPRDRPDELPPPRIRERPA